MKLACSSVSFSALIDRGDVTQLEFLDRAAHELRTDGVVLDVRHFPRTDDDYLAQIKKMAIDYGLTIAAIASDEVFTAGEPALTLAMNVATAVGAPLLTGMLARETAQSRSDQAQRLSDAAHRAKAQNVVLAVRNAPGTFAATSADCKRVAKETDSAWLRFALDPSAFDAASEPAALSERAVLLWSGAANDPVSFARAWENFGGFLVVESHEKSAHRTWREALSQVVLNRA